MPTMTCQQLPSRGIRKCQFSGSTTKTSESFCSGKHHWGVLPWKSGGDHRSCSRVISKLHTDILVDLRIDQPIDQPVNHEKSCSLYLTTTLANFNRFLWFSDHFKCEDIMHATVVKFTHHLNCGCILPDKIQKYTFYIVHEKLACKYDCNSVKSWPISTIFAQLELVINFPN